MLAQPGFDLDIQVMMTLNFWSSCLPTPECSITSVCHYAWFVFWEKKNYSSFSERIRFFQFTHLKL